MRVLLSGYYGFGNLGDEAILAGLSQALRARGHVPVALSGDPERTRREHSLEARHRIKGLPAALASADAVVSGGGGLLQDKTSARSLAYYLWVLRLARWWRRPVAVYGQSIGPLGDEGRARVAHALRDVPLFVRDHASLAVLAELGLEAALVGDAALLLAGRGSRPTAPNVAADAPIVLIPRGGYQDYNATLERLAVALAKAGQRLAVLALHPAEDLVPARRLAAAGTGCARWEATSVRDATTQLATARYVVSARLHGCILAAVAGVGFAGLSYDPKVAGFLEQAKAPVFQLPVAEAALLSAATDAAPPDFAAIAGLVESAHAGVDSLLEALR